MPIAFEKYYRLDKQMQLREIRRLPLKVFLFIAGIFVLSVSGILTVDRLTNDPLGLGYDRARVLANENKLLQEQMVNLTSRMEELDKTVKKLSTQGNELRLMVDLPEMEKDVANAGTGGAIQPVEPAMSSEKPANVLQSALASLQRLNGEIKVQQQSYEEIINKYEYNKGYFASLPALKPMEGFYSLNDFGLRMHPVLGVFKTHEGLDIVNDVGTPVYAAGEGDVTLAGQSEGGYGITVVINHGYGYQTLYAHLSEALVRENQHVRRGDLIAKSGRSGLVTGPHLHYEVRYNGVCKNPVDFFLDEVSAKSYRSNLVSR